MPARPRGTFSPRANPASCSHCQVLPKDELIGRLEPTTREWRDGVITDILRRTLEAEPSAAPSAERGSEQGFAPCAAPSVAKRHWLVFDGDVDPEWVEALNSVLDDNKVLTLPTGERLPLPAGMRALFEVTDLRHATLATVSRCAMVHFGDAADADGRARRAFLRKLRSVDLRSPAWHADAPTPRAT